MPEPLEQFGVMGLVHQFVRNRQRLENGMILSKTGLLQVRQKKGQAFGPLRVTFRRLVADAINMTVKTHDHSV